MSDEHEGLFDFIWDTDTEMGEEMSRSMEEAYKNGEFSIEVE